MRKDLPTEALGVFYDKPGKIEHYEKRFGIIAIRKNFISAEDFINALSVQVNEDIHEMPHRLIGKILYDMNLMTDKQIEEILGDIFR
jgi:hypothetical protein